MMSVVRLLFLLLSVVGVFACTEADEAVSGDSVPEGDAGSAITADDAQVLVLRCSEALSATYRSLEDEQIELSVSGVSYVLQQQRSASGARYVGEAAELWNKGNEALLLIGDQRYQCTLDQ